MPRHKFISDILFNTSAILLTIRRAYLSIHYSTMPRHTQNGYCHNNGTDHNSKKQWSSVIYYIPGSCLYDRKSLVGTHLPPLPDTNIAAVMAVYDQYYKHDVHMLESSRRTFSNYKYVHLSLISMKVINYNVDGVFLPPLQVLFLPLRTIPKHIV